MAARGAVGGFASMVAMACSAVMPEATRRMRSHYAPARLM